MSWVHSSKKIVKQCSGSKNKQGGNIASLFVRKLNFIYPTIL
jgi:hypothetical protein